jgi:hypothetical protein
MNIFYIHEDPKMCAEWAVDSHCIKMILESAQLLSTAHRVLDGHEYIDDGGKRKVKRWRLDDDRNVILYSATHVNHPSAVWARENNNNYNWLWRYLEEHCMEYTYRYGKVHKVEQSGLLYKLISAPHNIPLAPFTQPPSAMDTKYIISKDAVTNYRNYYKHGKVHLHKWKNRDAPQWLKEA